MDDEFRGVSRRELLIAGATTGLATGVAAERRSGAAASEDGIDKAAVPTARVVLHVNGQRHALEMDTRTSLLDALREHLKLTGTKKGCDQGQCGACTVLVNGRRINSCLSLAVMHGDDEITTIEGIGSPERMHPLQIAFVKHDAYQCGYCTPGQICSAVGMIDEVRRGIPSHVSADLVAKPLLSVDEMRERMSGNLCRCGAYSNLVEAMSDYAGGVN